MTTVFALIPIKARHAAKSRFSHALSAAQRAALQRALLEDLLNALSHARGLTGIALYGPDPETAAIARRRGLMYLPQPDDVSGLNASISDGVRRLVCNDASIIAVLPGDIPLLCASDLDNALSSVAVHKDCAVIPNRLRDGTNGLVFPAAHPPTFRFGPDSFSQHLSDPTATTPRRAMFLPSMADDIDTPEDLHRMTEMTAPGHTHAFLRTLNHTAPCLGPKETLR